MRTGPILIIDDDEGIRDILKVILEAEGYQTIVSKDGLEGLQTLRKNVSPSLILLDYMMPVMDGKKFMEEFIKDTDLAKKCIPVIMITAFSDVKLDGLSGALQKPLEMNQILKTVKIFCDTSQNVVDT